MTWVATPDEWRDEKIFLVRHSGLREGMNLEKDRQHYSLTELLDNNRIGLAINTLRGKQGKEEKLDSYFQVVAKMASQIQRFHIIANGADVRVSPGDKDNKWLSVKQLKGESQELFLKVVSSFAGELNLKKGQASTGLKASVDAFVAHVKKTHGDTYAPFARVKTEVHYNNFQPFKWSWIFYLLCVFLILLSLAFDNKALNRGVWLTAILGIILHVYGISLRVFISERPPVSNMFETVIWVPLVAMISALIAEYKLRNKIILLGASLVSVLCLILCYLSPTILDASFTPLEPVLRDNFWLLTHVVIIVSSYGPYFLAFLLGDLALIYFLIDENKYKKQIKELAQIMYRCIQIGSVLLLAGTILGGVWADYSWGRFWGWDPKETWAFIAFMGYIAVLHGRLVGWVRDFGMAVCSVGAFSLVIMAWYGVNYVLGAGLHSYGFGAGGLEYVATFVGIHFLFIGYVYIMRLSKKAKK